MATTPYASNVVASYSELGIILEKQAMFHNLDLIKGFRDIEMNIFAFKPLLMSM